MHPPVTKDQVGSLICLKCGQSKRIPRGMQPPEGDGWHTCDPENAQHPARKDSKELLQAVALQGGETLQIGGKDLFETAYEDVKKRSTKI